MLPILTLIVLLPPPAVHQHEEQPHPRAARRRGQELDASRAPLRLLQQDQEHPRVHQLLPEAHRAGALQQCPRLGAERAGHVPQLAALEPSGQQDQRLARGALPVADTAQGAAAVQEQDLLAAPRDRQPSVSAPPVPLQQQPQGPPRGDRRLHPPQGALHQQQRQVLAHSRHCRPLAAVTGAVCQEVSCFEATAQHLQRHGESPRAGPSRRQEASLQDRS